MICCRRRSLFKDSPYYTSELVSRQPTRTPPLIPNILALRVSSPRYERRTHGIGMPPIHSPKRDSPGRSAQDFLTEQTLEETPPTTTTLFDCVVRTETLPPLKSSGSSIHPHRTCGNIPRNHFRIDSLLYCYVSTYSFILYQHITTKPFSVIILGVGSVTIFREPVIRYPVILRTYRLSPGLPPRPDDAAT